MFQNDSVGMCRFYYTYFNNVSKYVVSNDEKLFFFIHSFQKFYITSKNVTVIFPSKYTNLTASSKIHNQRISSTSEVNKNLQVLSSVMISVPVKITQELCRQVNSNPGESKNITTILNSSRIFFRILFIIKHYLYFYIGYLKV